MSLINWIRAYLCVAIFILTPTSIIYIWIIVRHGRIGEGYKIEEIIFKTVVALWVLSISGLIGTFI